MAQVDFSHALLRPVDGQKPLEGGGYLNAYFSRTSISNSSKESIVDNFTAEFLEKSMKKMVVVYTGEFTEGGTELYIGNNRDYWGITQFWRVSNISFSAGDMFSFKVTMEITS